MIRLLFDLIRFALVAAFIAAGYLLWWTALAVATVTRWIFRIAWNRPRTQITATNGIEYEHCVAGYLRRKGYTGVKVTQASGDYGVDVIASRNGKKYAVQCKYYAVPVGVDAVQEAVTGKAHYGCNGAMVVTNSTFTKAAETLARENGVLLIPEVSETGDKPLSVFATWFITICVFFLGCGVSVAFTQGSLFEGLSVLALVTAPIWLGPIFRCITWKIRDKKLSAYTHPEKVDRSKKIYTVQTANMATNFKQTGEHHGDLKVSPIIGLPTKFKIMGEDFNLDDIDDIRKMPLNFSSFHVNGERYYFNNYFRLCANLYEKNGRSDLATALTAKAAELENHPLHGKFMRDQAKTVIKAPVQK